MFDWSPQTDPQTDAILEGLRKSEWVITPYTPGASAATSTATTCRFITVPVCPDLLRYDDIGAADGARGRVVRAFFWFMQLWPTK